MTTEDKIMSTGQTRRTIRIVSVLLYLVLLFALVELLSYYVVVHVYDSALGNRSERHLYSSIRGHQLNPGYQRQFDTGGQRIHSDQGFRRDTLVEVPKADDTYRIFLMGGSTAYGIGTQGSVYPEHPTLTNQETVSHFLEQDLQTRLPDVNVEVINAALPAYHSFQHVLYLYESLYEYEPDMVLFLDGHNDFYNLGITNPIQSYGYSSSRMVHALNDRKPLFASYAFLRFFADYSYTFKLASKMVQGLYNEYEIPPYNTHGDVTAVDRDFSAEMAQTAQIGFLRNYKLIETLGELHGFCYHVFLQPEIVFEDAASLSPADQQIAQITRDRYTEGREALMLRSRPEFVALFEQAGIPFTEIGEIGGASHQDNQLYIDYTHLTAEGSKLVAATMLPVAIDRIAQCGANAD